MDTSFKSFESYMKEAISFVDYNTAHFLANIGLNLQGLQRLSKALSLAKTDSSHFVPPAGQVLGGKSCFSDRSTTACHPLCGTFAAIPKFHV